MGFVRLFAVSLFLGTLVSAQSREKFENATVQYDSVTNSKGQKLRTYITRPKTAPGRVPVIFFVGWLSCDSVEYPAESDGFGAALRRLIDQSGYATIRMDKPGIGGSEGECAKADYLSELEGYQAAFDSIGKYDFMDPQRVAVIGLSNGGGTGPVVSRGKPVRAYVSVGSWGRTWYEHMLENERVRLSTTNTPPGEITTQLKAFAQFYDLYLNRGMTPGEILEKNPEWKGYWYDEPEGQYGRPAAFYQQLQSLNLGEAWGQVDVPVLVIRGTADTIMSHSDSYAIVDSVNRSHPGRAKYLEIDGMSHGLTVNRTFHDPLVTLILQWLTSVVK